MGSITSPAAKVTERPEYQNSTAQRRRIGRDGLIPGLGGDDAIGPGESPRNSNAPPPSALVRSCARRTAVNTRPTCARASGRPSVATTRPRMTPVPSRGTLVTKGLVIIVVAPPPPAMLNGCVVACAAGTTRLMSARSLSRLERHRRRLRRRADPRKVRLVAGRTPGHLVAGWRADGLCLDPADRPDRHDEGAGGKTWNAVLASIVGVAPTRRCSRLPRSFSFNGHARGNHRVTQIVEHPSGDHGAPGRLYLCDERRGAE